MPTIDEIIKERVIYFLGLSSSGTREEKLFNALFDKEEYSLFYITLSKEIAEKRRDLEGKVIVRDFLKMNYEENSAIFIPQGSTWYNRGNLIDRYVALIDILFEKGLNGILFSSLDKDAENWGITKESFLTSLIKLFIDKDFPVTQINFCKHLLLYVENQNI